MRYFIIIIFSLSLLSQRELNKLTYKANGRWDFDCIDDSTCYAIDIFNFQNQQVYLTTDQGKSWQSRSEFNGLRSDIGLKGDGKQLAYFYNDSTYYFLHYDFKGTLYYTNNYGESFFSKSLDIIRNTFSEMVMLNKSKGIISNTLFIITTKDNWNSWDTTYYDNITAFRNIVKRTDSTAYITAHIYQPNEIDDRFNCLLEFNINTFNYRLKYVFPDNKPNANGNIFNSLLYFYNDNIGFFGGSIKRESEQWSTDILYKTTDGGNSWYKVLDEYNGYFSLKDIAMAKDGQYGLTVDANKYYETFDGGETWHFGFWEPPEGEPYHVTCNVEFAGIRCLIGSMGKGIYAWEELTSISLEEIGNLKVWQNGSTFRIGSDINELQINIFDLQGNHVNTKNFNKNTIIDLSDKPTGTYLFNIIHHNLILKSGKLSVVN